MADNSSNVAIIALFLIAILVGGTALAILFVDDFTLTGRATSAQHLRQLQSQNVLISA